MENRISKNVLMILGWYSSAVHHGIARYAREHSWHLVIRYNYLRMLSLKEWHGDGLIVSGNELFDAILNEIDQPVVTLTHPDRNRHFQLVRENDFRIGEIAAGHFLERGFRHFAKYPANGVNARELRFGELVEQAGYRLHRLAPEPATTARDELAGLGEQLQKLPKPCAVFCENDLHAHDLLNAALFSGCSVPEELAIIGVGNDPLICETSPVTLSSIDNNAEQIGYEAAATLDRLMNGEAEVGPPVWIEPQPTVEVRESSDFFAVGSDALKAVLGYLRRHSSHELQIETVARRYGLSKSALYKLFQRHLGRSPKQVLTGFRLETACRLLRGTALKSEAVAAEAGFPDSNAMYVAFRHYLGQAPGAWRKRG